MHDHKHEHKHDHAHDHSHGGANTYFVDQLCTIGITGAYAAVMAVLFFGPKLGSLSPTLYRIFGSGEDSRNLLTLVVPWIQYLVVGGSFLLFALAIIRAVGVWRAAGHNHAHHDHAPGECCDHDHGHDHQHGWSPLRYVPLVIPLMLYFMGLPNDDMIRRFEQSLMSQRKPADHTGMAATDTAELPNLVANVMLGAASLPTTPASAAGLQVSSVSALGGAADYFEEIAENVEARGTDLGQLEAVASSQYEDQRQLWKSFPRVEVEGFFDPGSPDGRYFRVVRLRMACCLNDAQPAFMLGVSRKPLKDFKNSQWIVAQGKLDFMYRDGKWYPIMKAYSVRKKPQPANIYLK